MKVKNVIGKIYVSPNANLGHSEAFVEFFVEPNCSSLKAFYPPYTIRYRSKKISLTERSSVCVMLN